MFNDDKQFIPLQFDLENSSKNYLLVPLKLTKNTGSSLAYEIDTEVLQSCKY